MKYKIEITRRALRLLYEMLFTYLLVLFFEIIWIKEEPTITIVIAMILQFVVSYIVREKVASYIGILLLHIILTALVFVVDFSGGQRLLLVCISIHLLSDSMVYAVRRGKLKPIDDIPWPTFLISILIYVFGWVAKEEMLYNTAFFVPIILLFLYYIMIYFEGIKSYVESTRDMAGLPLGNILSINSLIVIFILFFLLAGIIVGGNIDLGKVITWIGNLIVGVFKIFAFGLAFIFRLITRLMSSGTKGDKVDSNEEGDFILTHEGTAEDITYMLFKIIFVALTLYFVYRIVRAILVKLSASRRFDTDVVEDAERIILKREESTKKRFFKLRFSGEEKIRRYYKQRILRDKYDISLKNKTCREIQVSIAENSEKDIEELTDIYASVRYGEVVPDKALVKRVSRLSKQ